MPTPAVNICVYCGSKSPDDKRYQQAAVTLGKELVARQVGLIYGGGRVGLMGEIAQAVLDGGGHVTGVIPRDLMDRELGHTGVTELFVVDDMHNLYSKSDLDSVTDFLDIYRYEKIDKEENPATGQ